MTEKLERPTFLTSFFSALAERAAKGTIWRMFIVPIIAGTLSGAVAYYMPAVFWSDDKWDVAATVYTGILTLNGLILALCWGAFSRIYESISAPKFCGFLRRNNLLNKYIVTVSSIHGLQVLAIGASGVGLIALLLTIPYPIVDRVLFAGMLFASIYAMRQAIAAVGIMHDLLWQKAVFDEHDDGAAGRNVVPMGNRGE